MAKWLYIKGN